MTVTPITLANLTTATLDGTGVFDVLMRANKAHLESEFTKGRIKGTEYATVYLGSLEAVMNAALNFLLQKDKASLEAQLLAQQILLAQVEVTKATATLAQIEAQTALVNQQTTNAQAELAIIQANALKVPAEVAHLQAQTLLVGQQKTNLVAEGLNIPKQGSLIDAQKDVQVQQKAVLVAEVTRTTAQSAQITAETANVPKQGLLIDAQTATQTQQKLNLVSEDSRIKAQTSQITAETLNVPKQGLLLDAQTSVQTQQKTALIAETSRTTAQTTHITAETLNVPKQGLLIDAQTAVQTQQITNLVAEALNIPKQGVVLDKQALDIVQKTANAVKEGLVLVAQECKLRAEYDLLILNKDKTTQETSLLLWKTNTEKAQTLATGVDANSVIGKQKALYGAQADGFTRDAEQKAAKIMVDSWNVRRTTDEGTVADGTNMLNDATVGRAVNRLLGGVGA